MYKGLLGRFHCRPTATFLKSTSVNSSTNVKEIKEALPSKEPEITSTPPKKDAMEQICKNLGTPLSKNPRQEGTAFVRFMNKQKD